ncbi:hypothetical protein GGS23DRAFT_245806 [Durotheca rogersii]|uniref:uncharacterized protein n=1 Tax=Durotheca rogersii TaxID=419775 RepID=UPI00221EB927|nr:uncharacterized protein GGS23DRAFT_245806 [Durotheca rogersii]KAI5860039.1 hypothetical protein GGS23DRAFT_245806 [Durotheca rogersii]
MGARSTRPENEKFRPSSPTSRSSSSGVDTPTDTTMGDDSKSSFDPFAPGGSPEMHVVPWPGKTFAIREHAGHRYLTLVDGELRAVDNVGMQGGWYWTCKEQGGWLGFLNPVSGTYMGHNGKGEFWAKYNYHKVQESFCATQHPQGGYLLLTRRDSSLVKMTIAENGSGLVQTESAGTQWDFLEV